nr:BTB/POZ domain-containing protein At5g48800 [Tanacetum cinerariifolium]
MNAEMDALYRNNTWVLVDLPTARKAIGSKWVFKIKYKSDGEIKIFKARLVAKCFNQKEGVDFDETFSPVVKIVTVRYLINLDVQSGWSLFQMDINNAFLYGDLNESFYMTLHLGYFSVDETKSKSDYSLFTKSFGGVFIALLVYVDDIIITGNSLPESNKHHYHHHHPPTQSQLTPAKSSRQRYNEWIFRDVPSDITIEVNGVTFALHKFPLVSRCGRIRKLVSDHRDNAISKVELLSLPGGVESFEQAAKFCYGINFEITSSNVAQLCCISDYLEMTEKFSTRNLNSRANEYLDTVVTKNLEMAVEVLKQSENLLPLADNLKIISRCIDAIASKACVEQITSSFSRLEYSSSGRLHMSRQVKGETDWWIKDLSVLRVDMYQRVMTAMKCRGVRPESIGESLMSYAEKELTSLYNLNNKKADTFNSLGHEGIVVETIVGLLPVEKMSVPLTFLFGLLRAAIMLDCAAACRTDLERRIGSQLDLVTLDDLLIPSLRSKDDTLFDVDVVHRILVNFSQQDDSENEMEDGDCDGDGFESDGPDSPSQTALDKVT